MPELPDLHVFSLNLKNRILDRNISSVKVFNTRKIDTPVIFSQMLTGTSIKGITREGKELHFLLANGNCFGVHLMLNGKFYITAQDEIDKISAKIMSVFFEDGGAFTTADIGGLCKVMLNPKPSKTPDAMSDKFTFEYFSGVLKKNSSKNIKAVLIDQSVVRGIGNAYVDEILWKAGISPESVTGKIPEEKTRSLYEAVPFMLNDAIENILKISPEIISGEERGFLRVHNPRKKTADDGGRIIVKQVASKKTYFTDKQELFV
ncbi:MAG: hypothetical protein LBH43_17855 [Treponema sp.]|jgi:formamidopyrimidine-DNA glycosylase|nr:hypothetical protein [Treponema sp.]